LYSISKFSVIGFPSGGGGNFKLFKSFKVSLSKMLLSLDLTSDASLTLPYSSIVNLTKTVPSSSLLFASSGYRFLDSMIFLTVA